MMAHLWSFLAIVGVVLLALWINSYTGISKLLAPAGATTV